MAGYDADHLASKCIMDTHQRAMYIDFGYRYLMVSGKLPHGILAKLRPLTRDEDELLYDPNADHNDNLRGMVQCTGKKSENRFTTGNGVEVYGILEWSLGETDCNDCMHPEWKDEDIHVPQIEYDP